MPNPDSIQEKETYKILWDFEIQNRSSNLGQTARPSDSPTKIREPAEECDFAVSADHEIKLKESEKGNKYLDLA